MKPNLFLSVLLFFVFCSKYSEKKHMLTGNKCKIWKPNHWNDEHFECLDSKGQRAIYKLDKGELVHIPRMDDIVYDWKWEIPNDTTIFLAESPFKINYLTKDSFAFVGRDGFILNGKNVTNNFIIKKCDCRDLSASKK